MSELPIEPTLPAHDYIPAGQGLDYLPQLKALFASSGLLEGFDDVTVEVLASHLRLYRQAAGKMLLREGERSDFALLLLEGEVDVLKSHEDYAPHIIGTASPGKLIGEMSLVDGEPRFASCVTRTEVLVAVLTRASLFDIIETHPRIGARLLVQLVAVISQRLRHTSKKLVSLLVRGDA